MARRILLPAMIAVLLASFLVACSDSGSRDPYATVTLHQVTQGTVVSRQFKYRFENPEIVALHRNLGLIREGNLIEFIAGRSLEDKLEGRIDGDFQLNVVKLFSPFVHFKVEQIATATDTTFLPQTGAIGYPRLMNAADFTTDNYTVHDVHTIPYNRTGTLNQLKDKKLEVSARVTLEEEEGIEFFMLHGDNAKFRVASPGIGTGLILKVLAEKNYLFEGGIILTEVEPFGQRRNNKIAGTVEIQFVRYADRIITG